MSLQVVIVLVEDGENLMSPIESHSRLFELEDEAVGIFDHLVNELHETNETRQ